MLCLVSERLGHNSAGCSIWKERTVQSDYDAMVKPQAGLGQRFMRREQRYSYILGRRGLSSVVFDTTLQTFIPCRVHKAD